MSIDLAPQDEKLTLKVNGRVRPYPPAARTVLLRRLTDTVKLVIRRSTRSERLRGHYCESCNVWYAARMYEGAVPEKITCECGRIYRLEVAFYEEVLPAEDFLEDARAEEDENVGPDDERGGDEQLDTGAEGPPAGYEPGTRSPARPEAEQPSGD